MGAWDLLVVGFAYLLLVGITNLHSALPRLYVQIVLKLFQFGSGLEERFFRSWF
jgi:hypothetical protein